MKYQKLISIQEGSQRPKWSENKSAQFSTNISNEQVNDIKMYIENARHDMVNINKETMNNICGKIANTFTQAAGKSFGDQNDVKDITDSKDSKRWFGYNCRKTFTHVRLISISYTPYNQHPSLPLSKLKLFLKHMPVMYVILLLTYVMFNLICHLRVA